MFLVTPQLCVRATAVVLLCMVPLIVAAQSARPSVEAYRLADGESIVIDGAPDESAWEKAVPATDFRQRDPDNGAPATERTEVRVIVDKDRLILGVTLFDSEPDKLLGNQMQRDEPFSSDDRFLFSLDSFNNGRTGYFFEINPSGAMGDGLITGPTGGGGGGRGGGGGGFGGGFGGGMNKSWDGIWIARVRRTSIGWTAEIEIPFKTLNFDPNTTVWGANFQRTVKRKNEESLWTGWLRDEGLTRMSNAGQVRGISNITQGLGLDLKPYIVGSGGSAPGLGKPATTGDATVGMDAFYNVTPALKANFTVNTDFAETEVDQRRTNLTRFPLFFPEKREFFLDGANYFSFGAGNVTPFFSRRIGLNQGEAQPIAYGGKLVGQVGNQDVAFLQMSTREDTAIIDDVQTRLPGEDFTVARVQRRFGTQSSAGVLYTRRAARDSIVEARHSMGVDLSLATPTFLGDKTFDSDFWFLHTTKPEFLTDGGELPADGGTDAYGFRASLGKDPWRTSIGFQEYEAAYNAAVGFTPRRNFRRWNPSASFNPRLRNHPFIRGFQFSAWGDINLSLENKLVDRNIRLNPFEVEFHSGDRLQLEFFNQTENLQNDFEISDGVVLPAGRHYQWTRYQMSYRASSRRKLSGNIEYSGGPFWDGDRREVQVELNIRPRPGVNVQMAAEFNNVDLPAGSFTTRLYRIDARTQFSPWISLSNNVQYDSDSGSVGWQMRFRWIQTPGSDVFFIWTQNWIDDPLAGFQPFDRRAAAKIVKTIRF